MNDFFDTEKSTAALHLNIYADEIQNRECPVSREKWIYTGIIFEKIQNPLLPDIIAERFLNNFDEKSPYQEKNNKTVHWCKINIADTKHICQRWFNYILDPQKSGEKFYCFILGLNVSKLSIVEFSEAAEFNSIYNRFFRSAVVYAVKTFFPDRTIYIENIFHETGQQEQDKYFPWHIIYKLRDVDNLNFSCQKIIFLPKNHKADHRSNIIQLCDCFMGAVTSLIHGIERTKSSKLREELMCQLSPLVERMVKTPFNVNSRYKHSKRILIRFFPKESSVKYSLARTANHFYTNRALRYLEQISGQPMLFE